MALENDTNFCAQEAYNISPAFDIISMALLEETPNTCRSARFYGDEECVANGDISHSAA